MKERPIIFSGPMVRAILDGRKTQTRRIAKLTDAGHVKERRGHRRWHPEDRGAVAACPYGQPGDRLWVRETWGAPHPLDTLPPRMIPPTARIHYGATENLGGLIRRPSIHMPRWAARILLEITDVRVERLQRISEADAMAEGVAPLKGGGGPNHFTVGVDGAYLNSPTAGGAFAILWDWISGDGAWDENPWVWVVDFRAVNP